MIRFRRSMLSFAFVVSMTAASLPGQTAPARAHDPVLSAIKATEPDYPDARTRNLEVLTQIWGNVALYNPHPSALRMKWDDVLIAALRALPDVHDQRDLAALLNRVVFAPLHDPLLYATTRMDDVVTVEFPAAGSTRRLGAGVAYISAVDQGYRPRFGPVLRRLIDSVVAAGDVRQVVVDLRSGNRATFTETVPGAWLGMWAERSLGRGQALSMLRSTDEFLGAVKWIMTPTDSLVAVPPAVTVPTVFVVNRTSYASLAPSLDAIRSARRDVAVAMEPTGPIPNLGYNSFQSWYPDSILLPHYHLPMVAGDGALGTVVDTLAVQTIPIEQIATVADRALALRAGQAKRPAFQFPNARIQDDPVSLGPLTREQRLAGLLKTWFWVSHFYAYLDDASIDWRHLISVWGPRIEAAQDDREYYRLLSEISALLNDTHSDVSHPLSPFPLASPATTYAAPIRVGWIGDQLVVLRVDSADASFGMRPGDEIIAVDGQTIPEIERKQLPLWSVSTPKHHVPTLFLLGAKDSRVTMRARTQSGVRDFVLPRSRGFGGVYAGPLFDHPAFSVLPGNIGFLNLAKLRSAADFDSGMTALSATRGMIVDDQGAPAGAGNFDLFRFIADPAPFMRRVESVTYLHGSEMPANGFVSSESWTVPSPRRAPSYTKPLVVMIGLENISRYESLAQWLKLSKRATFVGRPTNGTYGTKDGVTLPGGAVFHFTAGRAVLPDGTKYHGVGIVPDVRAEATMDGLRSGRDEVFEAAVRTMQTILRGSR